MESGRDLQETQAAITTRCWTECVKLALTADECTALIKEELGANLELHEIPNLQITVHTPRDSFWFGLTYFQVGIPTDLFGNVACEKSVLRYDFDWEVIRPDGSTDVITIPDFDCIGKTATNCCTDYKAFLTDLDIPLVDSQGNCLSCWVHQEPLEPIIATDGSGNVLYVDHQYDPSTKECKAVSIPEDMVIDIDASTTASLNDDIVEMESMLEQDFATCASLIHLQERLMIHARGVNTAMNFVASLLCGFCEGRNGSYGPIPDALRTKFVFVVRQIRKAVIKSNVNYIIIYTDADGNVIEPPKVGGSRAGIDWNLDDPDCDENTGGDTGTPPSNGGDTGTPPTTGGETGTSPTTGGDTGTPPTTGGDTGTPPTTGGDTGTPPTTGGDTGSPPTTGGDTGTPPTTGGDTGTPPTTGGDTTGGGGGDVPPGFSYDERSTGGGGLPSGSATCEANAVTSNPVLGAQFSSFDVAFACSAPTGEEIENPNGYSLELVAYDASVLKGDSMRTRFTYKVCSKLDDLVNRVVIPWKGHCTVTKYHYLDIEFEGCGYEAGKDDISCVAGFIFDESWQSVAAYADPASNKVCAEFLLEVDGWVSKVLNVGSLSTESGEYVLIGVQGPDCTAC